MTEWQPTMELRFLLTDRLKVLQQKWIETKQWMVTDGPNLPPRKIEEPTGNHKWQTVPLVEEAADDTSD